MLRILTPWDSQPQEAAGVDWGNPLTDGLAYLTRAPQFPDAVKGRINSGTRTLSVSSGGVGATYSGAGGDAVTIDTVVNGTSYALLASFNLTALTPLQQIFTQDSSSGGTNRINQLRVGSVSGVVDFIVFNTAGSAFTVSSAAIGLGPHTVLAVATASGTIELYVDGVRTSNTFTGTLRSPSAAVILPVIGNRNGVSEPFLGSINCVGLYTGVVPTQSAANSICANPWQLFAPRSIWVPVSVGGGGPTTYYKSLGGILTTSAAARKRITAVPRASSMTPAGAITAQVKLGKAVTGSLTPAGLIRRKVSKGISGVLTGTGVLRRNTKRIVVGSLTAAGTVVRKVKRTLTGSLTGTSVLTDAFKVLKATAGSLTGSGSLSSFKYTPVPSLISRAAKGLYSMMSRR